MMKIGSAELQIGTESRCIEGASVGAMVFCGMFFSILNTSSFEF
jgi:hypothetical protein